MKLEHIIEISDKLSKPYRVTDGKKFQVKDADPADTQDFTSEDKPHAQEALQAGVQALAQLQDATLINS